MEWEGDAFPGIDLADITTQGVQPDGSASYVLYTNGNCTIAADNTATAQLSETGADTLVTEYKLVYDGDGTTATGGDMVDWTVHSGFLSTPSGVTHYGEDGAVSVTLWARASNESGTLADAADYTATQTLTASWV